jgi:hypothetical protein
MSKWTVELGSEVKSTVSGFTGIVTARSEHLNGCNRYWVAPKVGKDGKMPEGCWLDEGELENTKATVLQRGRTDRGGFPSRVK